MEKKKKKKYVKFYTNSIKHLLELNLTQREYKVMFYLIPLIDSNNRLLISTQREIAESSNMAQPNVCNIFKSLINKKILLKHNNKLYFHINIIQPQ